MAVTFCVRKSCRLYQRRFSQSMTPAEYRRATGSYMACTSCGATLRYEPAVRAEHKSDCSVNNEPAYPAGPCDCGAEVFK